MFLLVGLGNPGEKYCGTRHNLGFMAVDALARSFCFPEFFPKHDSLVSTGDMGTHRVMLLKPLTFMNASGRAVLAVSNMYKVPLDRIIVFHDDAELPSGIVRVKQGGGSGGHKGIRSIDSSVGRDYWRVRVGIGKPEIRNLSEYVLSNFESSDSETVTLTLGRIASGIIALLDGDLAEFLSRLPSNKPKSVPPI